MLFDSQLLNNKSSFKSSQALDLNSGPEHTATKYIDINGHSSEPPPTILSSEKRSNLIASWLLICSIMVGLVVVVGGLTRMTHSGLSIVEWRPITGIFFPLSEASWLIEFSKYQTSPEFKLVNFNLTLSQFKFIYFLEYFHRLIGRAAFLIFIIPFIYFYRRINIRSRKILFIVGILFILQGLMGWLMVKSGLINSPQVSHFRLALHLELAAIIFGLLFWEFLRHSFKQSSNIFMLDHLILKIILSLIYLQIFLGGMTAGLHAGLIYDTFPLMGNSYIPDEIRKLNIDSTLFYNPVFIQFIHRQIAYLITFLAIIVTWRLWRQDFHVKILIFFVLSVTLQVTSGIFTLLCHVSLPLALYHQINMALILASCIWLNYLSKIEVIHE